MNIKQKNIVITSASRTAIGTFHGSLKSMQAHELGSIVVKEVMKNSKLDEKDAKDIIVNLLKSGEIFEPKKGILKLLE